MIPNLSTKTKGVLLYSKKNKLQKSYFHQNSENSRDQYEAPKNQNRKISKKPYKILDAPKLKDESYNSLLDWSYGNQIAIGLGNRVCTWNPITNEVCELMEVRKPTMISSVSWCGRQELLAIGDERGTVKIYDVEKVKQIRTYDNHTQAVGALDWNGYMITSGSKDSKIYLSDIRTPRSSILTVNAHKQEVCTLKWSASEGLLASGGQDNKVIVSSLKMPDQPQSILKNHVTSVKALTWSSHNSNILATGGGATDKSLKFWNVASNTLIQSVDTGSYICNMIWSKNTDELVTTHGSTHNQIVVWEANKVQGIATLYGHTSKVLQLALSPDGENIVTGSGDETLRFWKVFPQKKSRFSSQLDSNQVDLR